MKKESCKSKLSRVLCAVLLVIVSVCSLTSCSSKPWSATGNRSSLATKDSSSATNDSAANKTYEFKDIRFDYDDRLEISSDNDEELRFSIGDYLYGGLHLLAETTGELSDTHRTPGSGTELENKSFTIDGNPALTQKFITEDDDHNYYLATLVVRYKGYDYVFMVISELDHKDVCDDVIDVFKNSIEFL